MLSELLWFMFGFIFGVIACIGGLVGFAHLMGNMAKDRNRDGI